MMIDYNNFLNISHMANPMQIKPVESIVPLPCSMKKPQAFQDNQQENNNNNNNNNLNNSNNNFQTILNNVVAEQSDCIESDRVNHFEENASMLSSMQPNQVTMSQIKFKRK